MPQLTVIAIASGADLGEGHEQVGAEQQQRGVEAVDHGGGRIARAGK